MSKSINLFRRMRTPITLTPIHLGIMLLLMTLSFNCATLASLSVPLLQNRTLEVSPQLGKLQYSFPKCVRKFLGICTRMGGQIDYYDLSDAATNKTLRDMNFVCKAREQK